MLDMIVDEACRATGVGKGEVLGGSQADAPALVRQLAAYAARELTGASWPQLGKYFQRHHSTMLVGVKRMKKDEQLVRAAEALVKRVREKV